MDKKNLETLVWLISSAQIKSPEMEEAVLDLYFKMRIAVEYKAPLQSRVPMVECETTTAGAIGDLVKKLYTYKEHGNG